MTNKYNRKNTTLSDEAWAEICRKIDDEGTESFVMDNCDYETGKANTGDIILDQKLELAFKALRNVDTYLEVEICPDDLLYPEELNYHPNKPNNG